MEYAATCYLQSVKHAPQRHKNELVNVLHLLAFSEHTGAVGRALAKHVDATQRWVWLPYVPQLLLSLLNREAPHAKALLLRVAQAHPQALYCPLRTFLLERRETAARVTQSARALAAKARESADAAAGAPPASGPRNASGDEPPASGAADAADKKKRSDDAANAANDAANDAENDGKDGKAGKDVPRASGPAPPRSRGQSRRARRRASRRRGDGRV